MGLDEAPVPVVRTKSRSKEPAEVKEEEQLVDCCKRHGMAAAVDQILKESREEGGLRTRNPKQINQYT
jgi:hypothetical protein